MYEIDFLPVESMDGPGSKSGDAITVRLAPTDAGGDEFVVVIDGGYSDVGDQVVEHLNDYLGTQHVNLIISTHPDADHINGLIKIVENCAVDELWIHHPREHGRSVVDDSNIEAIDNLIAAATQAGVAVTEPFTGLTAFGDRIRVLGPTNDYYEQLLDDSLAEAGGATKGLASAAERAFSKVLAAAGSALDKVLSELPVETLTDGGDTGPRNNTSVITLMQCDGRLLLFTGDAGIPALEQASDEFESRFGSFALAPLRFMQIPHHGSKHNVGPTILNRMLGEKGSPHSSLVTAFVSSAKASTKHPAAKVVNAFSRRGCDVSATEGQGIRSHHNGPNRGWTSLTPIGPLDESGEDE